MYNSWHFCNFLIWGFVGWNELQEHFYSIIQESIWRWGNLQCPQKNPDHLHVQSDRAFQASKAKLEQSIGGLGVKWDMLEVCKQSLPESVSESEE